MMTLNQIRKQYKRLHSNALIKKPRIVLFLHPNSDPTEGPRPHRPTGPFLKRQQDMLRQAHNPDCYELDMVNDSRESDCGCGTTKESCA